MTKWVTFLLLLLAVLVYGMSTMRPVPDQPTPEKTEVAVTVSPSATPLSETTPMPVVAATPLPAGTPAPATSPTIPKHGFAHAPHFGPAPHGPKTGATPVAEATPAVDSTPSGEVASQQGSKPARPQTPISGTVKATVFSESSGGPSRNLFSPNTESIYLTMTPEGIKDKVELVAKYRSVLKEEAPFSPDFESSGPPRRRTFRLTPPEKGWTEGPYQVVLSPKGSAQVVGLARFEVGKEKDDKPHPKPEYLDLVPDLEATDHQTSFSSKDKELILRVDSHALADGSVVRAVWSAVEVDQLTTGELVLVQSEPAPGEDKDTAFFLEAPPGGFHTGSYKVDVYFDDDLVGSQAFFIQPPPSKK